MKVTTVTFKVPREPVRDPDSNDWSTHSASRLPHSASCSPGSASCSPSPLSDADPRSLWGWGSGLVPFGEGRQMTQSQQRRWLGAWSWRRRVERVLVGSGLSFRQWLIMEATAALIATTGDAVSQGDVADYLGLNRMAVSRAMTVLDAKGLVSRGGPMSGPSWRIVMAEKGMNLLWDLAGGIESVSGGC